MALCRDRDALIDGSNIVGRADGREAIVLEYLNNSSDQIQRICILFVLHDVVSMKHKESMKHKRELLTQLKNSYKEFRPLLLVRIIVVGTVTRKQNGETYEINTDADRSSVEAFMKSSFQPSKKEASIILHDGIATLFYKNGRDC